MEQVQGGGGGHVLPQDVRLHSLPLPDGGAASLQQKQHPLHRTHRAGVRHPQQRKCHTGRYTCHSPQPSDDHITVFYY